MRNIFSKPGPKRDASFLPEDYLARKHELRTNTLSLALFVVVSLGVLGAFFWTNQRWNDVKRYQRLINVRYTQAAKDIEQVKVLEAQKAELMAKAELTTALNERVARSVLQAELINRLPKRARILSVELKSTRLDKPIRKSKKKVAESKAAESLAKRSRKSASATKAEVKEEPEEPELKAPQFETKVIMIGVTPSHTEVAQYVSGLQQCSLLTDVELIFSETTTISDKEWNKFRVEAMISKEADTREIQPLQKPRMDNFVSDEDGLVKDDGTKKEGR